MRKVDPPPVREHWLPEHSPYDAGRLLWFLGQHAVPGVEAWDDTSYGVVLRLPCGPGVVRVQPEGAGYDASLWLADTADLDEARTRMARLLDLSGDSAPGERALRRDPVLGAGVRSRPGLRLPGSVDPFETLIRTVIGQQISLAGARSVTGQVVSRYGEALPAGRGPGEGLVAAFPSPVALAAADPETLPMPRSRGRAVVGIAARVVELGPVDAAPVLSGSPDSARDLLALPGVGPWTAAYVALRVGRDPDGFLPTDLAVKRALERLGLSGEPADAAELARGWSPHRGLALMHLWLDLLESRAAGQGPGAGSRLRSAAR